MKYYPIFLRVAGRPCLVIGGGRVAEQKVKALLDAGARVTVVSPDMTPALAELAAAGVLTYHQHGYASDDLRGFFLAYAATSDDALHVRIARDAEAMGVLLNVVDHPPLGDFIAPAVMTRGDLIIATSTGGASPALAKRIRRDLEDTFGPEYDVALQLLRRIRERLAAHALTSAERQQVFTRLVESPLLDYLRERQIDAVDRLLAATVGDGVSLASLGVELT
jgi:precorrin-2 dehydrogenase/sirohydrochlorin ferrochelatase